MLPPTRTRDVKGTGARGRGEGGAGTSEPPVLGAPLQPRRGSPV